MCASPESGAYCTQMSGIKFIYAPRHLHLMGNKLIELMQTQEISLADLSGKTLVVDAYNQLYMFLATIRGPDGTLLTDSKGQITSHLLGIFTRFSRLMREGIRFIFVFDGSPPEQKRAEQARRAKLKQEAAIKYEEAKERGDENEMKKFAMRTSKLTKEMIDEARGLISAMGIPIVDAPGEGEAQAAHMVMRGDAYAVMSQDADSLIFGAPLLIKNLTITGKRKQPGQYASRDVPPERIDLASNLKQLEVTREQLIAMALLTGTDYNYGGVRGIGPKKALALIKKYPRIEDVFGNVEWGKQGEPDWSVLFELIAHPKTSDAYTLRFSKINEEQVRKILVDDHEFGVERVEKTLADLRATQPKETSLRNWFT
jgi:flap endonuclease-1